MEFFGGSGLGVVIGELLKAVLLAKEEATTFRSKLTRLELTLKGIVPRLHKLGRHKKSSSEMKELLAIIAKGTELVLECSKISKFDLVRKVQYSSKLDDLDKDLGWYFNIILPLDHYKETMETQKEVMQLKYLIIGASIILIVIFLA